MLLMNRSQTWIVVAALALTACTMKEESSKPAPTSQPCRKVGDNCEVSPGKLGTCIQQDVCTKPEGCFVCQSQH